MPEPTIVFNPKDTLLPLSRSAFADEAAQVQVLLQHCAPYQEKAKPIAAEAQTIIRHLRQDARRLSPFEAFLQEYSLMTEEGLAIMCLAETLLRIPDTATADAMIKGTLHQAQWEKHLKQSASFLVNASTWGLVLSGKILNNSHSAPETLLARMGEPAIRLALTHAMRMMGSQFIMGETMKDALRHAKLLEKEGYLVSYDMLGEGARTRPQAEYYFKRYMQAVDTLAHQVDTSQPLYRNPGISVKLSALHPRYQLTQEEGLRKQLLPYLKEIAIYAMQKGVMVTLDAEEASRFDLSLLLFHDLIADRMFHGFDGIGLAVQAYQKRAWGAIDYLHNLARRYQRKIPVRLVKGAYWDTEIKLAQGLGLPGYPVFTRKEHTDVSYLACAGKLLSHPESFFPQFATHNAHTVAALLVAGEGKHFEFQRLQGMGKALYDYILKNTTYTCRIYAPVGEYHALLPYLIRRLLENGANTSFVYQIANKEVTEGELCRDPIATTLATEGKPQGNIPLPENLYRAVDGRKNSQGFDLGNLAHLASLAKVVEGWQHTDRYACPIINGHERPGQESITHCRPSQCVQPVGKIFHATEGMVQEAAAIAKEAFNTWQHVAAEERARLLEILADLLETNRGELIALCVYEAGKTIADAIAEIREAADFCRYYAAQAREHFGKEKLLQGPTGELNTLQLYGRGVFACISPWNFPLAIFTGQIAAALAAGNCVIAKPSDQTPLIGYAAVKLMLEAGFPAGTIQFLPGKGSIIGNALVAHPDIAGVAFTGSTKTAQHINRILAAKDGPIVPFIAETGGQNVMMVDSTALHETAIDDIVLSAFGSAGQRCSALRVLYLQNDIADGMVDLLKHAMQELVVGLPEKLTTDIGPVIDKNARDSLQRHIQCMHQEAVFLSAVPLEKTLEDSGYFLAPHAFEISSIRQLKGEVFGPVLHVIRYDVDDLGKMVEEVNSTGFGLTFGIQSRLKERIEYLRHHVHAGNAYVNRSMIGATVGVQPFGGEGLSGTGPKAGGPHYLLRFATERTFTNNIAAIGGNVGLLTGVRHCS